MRNNPVAQPVASVLYPDITDSALVGAWLNEKTRGSAEDFSTNGNDGTASGGLRWGSTGVYVDGTDGTIDFGSIGSIAEVSMWVKPASTSEQLFRIDAGKSVSVSGGTITYTGLTASATYVDGAVSTTLAADEWQFVVCQFTADTAANFELAYDGTNYGELYALDLRASSSAHASAWIADQYAKGVPDSNLVLHVPYGDRDYSRYGLDIAAQADTIIGNPMAFDGTGDYIYATVSGFRSTDSSGTIMAWIKRAAIGSDHMIVCSSDEASTNRALQWNISTSNFLQVEQQSAGGVWNIVRSTNTIADTDWHFVALVSTGSMYYLYIDGEMETPATVTGSNNGNWFADTANRDNVTIGVWRRTGLLKYFNGNISDVRIYSDTKSADEIAEYYNKTQVDY